MRLNTMRLTLGRRCGTRSRRNHTPNEGRLACSKVGWIIDIHGIGDGVEGAALVGVHLHRRPGIRRVAALEELHCDLTRRKVPDLQHNTAPRRPCVVAVGGNARERSQAVVHNAASNTPQLTCKRLKYTQARYLTHGKQNSAQQLVGPNLEVLEGVAGLLAGALEGVQVGASRRPVHRDDTTHLQLLHL